MNDALASWIVTAVVVAGSALAFGLVKRWTRASLAEILFRWDPRTPRSVLPHPSTIVGSDEFERVHETAGKTPPSAWTIRSVYLKTPGSALTAYALDFDLHKISKEPSIGSQSRRYYARGYDYSYRQGKVRRQRHSVH
jgi:hypothetical protein